MCHDGNSASLSVRYLNSQLTSLWENAVECTEEGGHTHDIASAHYEKSKYTRALAQYHFFGNRALKTVDSTDDLLFFATFAKPELKFICNHEAVLCVTVEDGHLNLQYGKANATSFHIDQSKTKRLRNLQVAFRVPFTRSSVKGRDPKIANGPKHLIQILILDLSSAKMVTLRPDSEMSGSTKQALLFYLHKYLDFLQQAGHHVFFDLPEFHDGRQKATVDYSLLKHPVDLEVLCAGVSVHGINVQEINSFLHSRWMTAASLGRPQDLLTICLTEINSSWLLGSSVDTNFHVRFGPPKITALCQSEVIVYFDIEDIAFFSESDASNAEPNVYHNWQLAFVVDVVHEEGTNSCLKLDFATARFSLYYSSFEKCDALASSYFRKMVSFFSERYFAILTQYSMHITYSIDVGFGSISVRERPSSTSSESSVSWSDAGEVKEFRTHTNVALWTERTEKLHLGGFDQITSISEKSINTFFTLLRRNATDGIEASLARWSLDRFNATFSSLKIRLLSNGKAILWINISEGDMAVAKESRQKDFWTWIGWKKPSTEESTEMYEFTDLAIAFEVDLKIVEHAALDVSDTWHKMFKSSGLWTHNQTDTQDPVFKHLIFQFQTATYVPDLSSFQSLGEGRAALNRLQTITHYMQDYLASLANTGCHIIHSVPISGSQSSPSTNLWCTDVSFQTISKTEVTLRACWYKQKGSEAPVILILGMSDNRPMPQTRLQWSSAWNFFSKGESPVGVASLSREAFLDARILSLFALINADTTIVPKFAGVIDGKWEFDLTTWAQHVHRKGKECKWKFLSDRSADVLQYEWQHRDGWNHKYEGNSGDQEDAEYSLSCDTRNELRISTGFNRTGLEVQLKGESVIKVSGEGEQGSWSKMSLACWSASIWICSRADGLTVESCNDSKPFFSDIVSEGECSIEIREIHARHLSQTIDLSKVAHGLKAIFEGAWSYSSSGHHSHLLANSAFARDGSFVTQIGMLGTKQAVYAPQTPSSHSPRKSGVSTKLSLSSMVLSAGDTLSPLSDLDSPPLTTPPLPEDNIPRRFYSKIETSAAYTATQKMQISQLDASAEGIHEERMSEIDFCSGF